MTLYRLRADGTIKTLEEIKSSNLNLLLPAVLQQPEFDLLGIDPILQAPIPNITRFQYISLNGCIQDNLGNWIQNWVIVNHSTDYIAKVKSDYKLELIEKVKQKRDLVKFQGVFISNKWIHTDTYSRTQWMAMVMMGANLPIVSWTTMDKSTINTSQTLAMQVFQGVAIQDSLIYSVSSTHISNILALDDAYGYDILTGWPTTFQGT